MSKLKKDHRSRRKFIKQLTSGAIGFALADKIGTSYASFPHILGETKSKVVVVKHSKAIESSGAANRQIIQEMLDSGMIEFTGKKTLEDAWLQFFTSDETVSLKMNTLGLNNLLGTDYIQHFKAISDAVLNGLRSISMPEKNIIIWERSDEELVNGGYEIQREEGKLRVMGTRQRMRGENEGFNPESFPVGTFTTRVHRFITDFSSSYINMPVMKTHGIAGVSGSLKNHYGSIDNPRTFHENNATNPGIPEINAIPVIKNKQKLIIADALLGVFDGGPRWNRDKLWINNEIIIGTDPVAVDTVMQIKLDEHRDLEGLEPIEANAIHLPLSEELGLGNYKISNIDIQIVDLG
jgi:hypothetical protein